MTAAADAHDMTPAEACAEARKIAAEVGPEARLWIRLETDQRRAGGVGMTLYPFGIVRGDEDLKVTDGTFRGAFAKVRAELAGAAAKRAAVTIRKLALAIIDKADGGAVTELDLLASFNAGEIAQYGEAACAEATRLAGNAPFSIVRRAERAA
ncbi:hypothetical protein GCM10008171_32520 [Methylopila jiangsuensis]|uniref:Uncharacterized protein n=1 Tax=Methylopila jiangsuensis TaxID=586230 RepID=A0A9W6N548_9HYPH|nr:hypothetical protein [Methylopila jiangsuensis]MDR6284612.1 hypothetical protein [Methylopila jiangsuensis]GLK77998.1 hypothetical protein GCM10008171_32520 [Methylopila jiangsuensis]